MKLTGISSAILLSAVGVAALSGPACPQSGPDQGSRIPAGFHPLMLINPEDPKSVGTKGTYFEGGVQDRDPWVIVFARELDAPLAELLKKLDAALERHKKDKLHVFVVLLADQRDPSREARAFAEKHKIKHITFAADNPAGPRGWSIAKDAGVTIILARNREVRGNYTTRKNELRAETIGKIISDVDNLNRVD